MPKALLQVLLAIALVLLASYYWQPGGSLDADPDTVKRQMSLAKTYLYEARSWEYAEDGALKEILEASRMEYFGRRHLSELRDPRFYSHDGHDRTWSATAEKGRFKHRQDLLLLNRNVVLSNDQTGGRLTTRHMSVNVKTKIATSSTPVTVIQGENVITADGMVADLKRERIEMAPNVESTYVQAQP
jgi:lipopolysaccharide export system protein LptC